MATENEIRLAVHGIREEASRNSLGVFVAATGAGARLQALLWDVPGASAFLVGACFPYSREELDDFLGFAPEKSCCEDTAIEMAMAAYLRAWQPNQRTVGIGITAAAATIDVRRAARRVHVASMTDRGCFTWTAPLDKVAGVLRRDIDGWICDTMGFNALLHALNAPPLEVRVVGSCGERWEDRTLLPECKDATARAFELFYQHPLFMPDGRRLPAPTEPQLFIPGTFNPIHDGHRNMAAALEKDQAGHRNLKPVYSITADSVHKPPLSLWALLGRAAMLRRERLLGHARPFLFTRGDPLFVDKARQHPESCFAIGVDALIRLLDPYWYGGDHEAVLNMLDELALFGATFYVFGREIPKRGHVILDDIEVPGPRSAMFVQMYGRWPHISSTMIRDAAK